MEFQAIHMNRKERRRFLQIAYGDTTAKNSPEEDALIQKKLIQESMIVTYDPDTNKSTIDMRAVTLSPDVELYFSYFKNRKEQERKETRRFRLNTVLQVIAIAISVISVVVTIIIYIATT